MTELNNIEIALINELISRRASLAEIAEHFPSLTIDDINFHSAHHAGKYRRWDADQDELLVYMAQSYLTIAEMQEGLDSWFGFSRSEGALISRLKKLGFPHYPSTVAEHKAKESIKERRARSGFQRYSWSK